MRTKQIYWLCQHIMFAMLIALYAVAGLAQSNIESSESPEYQVWRIFRTNKKDGYSLAIVSVNSKHFNRKDMAALAVQLNREFAQETRLNVALFDETAPQYILKGGGEIPTFYAEQRGLYRIDRNRCKESIQFSEEKGKPQAEVIRFKCSRSR